MEDVFIGEEAELPKKVTIDVRPSKEEVELHNKTHLPYRSWCPHCVRGKARGRAQRRKKIRSAPHAPAPAEIPINSETLRSAEIFSYQRQRESQVMAHVGAWCFNVAR